MSESLYLYTACKLLTLADAMAACRTVLKRAETYALLYAAQDCYLAKVGADSQLYRMQLDARGQPYRETIDPAGIYEARLFHAEAELRWLHRHQGQGDAVLLTTTETLKVWVQTPEAEAVTGHIEQRYLLWGEGTGAPVGTGWSQLSTARIGAYLAPIGGIAPHGRVQLTAMEYLKTYSHGNVGVFEERLTGLQKAREEPADG